MLPERRNCRGILTAVGQPRRAAKALAIADRPTHLLCNSPSADSDINVQLLPPKRQKWGIIKESNESFPVECSHEKQTDDGREDGTDRVTEFS